MWLLIQSCFSIPKNWHGTYIHEILWCVRHARFLNNFLKVTFFRKQFHKILYLIVHYNYPARTLNFRPPCFQIFIIITRLVIQQFNNLSILGKVGCPQYSQINTNLSVLLFFHLESIPPIIATLRYIIRYELLTQSPLRGSDSYRQRSGSVLSPNVVSLSVFSLP